MLKRTFFIFWVVGFVVVVGFIVVVDYLIVTYFLHIILNWVLTKSFVMYFFFRCTQMKEFTEK